MADFQHRFELCELLAQEHPWLKVSDFEQKHNSPYTAQTLKRLTKEFPDTQFVWLMGSDNLATIHKWQQWNNIFQTVPIAVFYRQQVPAAGLHSPAAIKYKKYMKNPREEIGTAPDWRVIMMSPHAGRATTIRGQLARKEHPKTLTNRQLKRIKEAGSYRKTP